jgi:flagellar hook-associated protein 2
MSDFRIGGLASGIDTNSLIDQLMAIERKSEQLLQTKKQKIGWKKDLWGEVKSSLSALDTSIQTLLKRSTMMARSTTTSDDEVLTATATSDAALAGYDINVTALATSTKLTSGTGIGGIGLSGSIDPDQPISRYTSKFETNPTSGTFTVNGVTFNLSDSDSDSIIDELDVQNSEGTSVYSVSISAGITLNDIMVAFSDDDVKDATGVTATYSDITDKITITADAPGGDLNMGSAGDGSNFLSVAGLLTAQRSGDSITSVSHFGKVRTTQTLANGNYATAITGDADGNGEFTINGVSIAYNKNTDTLKNIIDRINSSSAGVNANYDGIQDRLILTNKNTGSLSITRADVTGNFLAAVDALTGASQSMGTNATLTISGVNDGNPISSTSNTITGLIAGVTLNPIKLGSTTITIGQDSSKAKEAVKDMVSKYNAALDIINTKLTEEKVDDPQYEYEAKKGLLRGDRQLADIKYNLVDMSISAIAGLSASADELSEIGITIDSANFGKSGKLVLDESKLDEMLAEDPGAVANLFFSDEDGDGKIDDDDTGIAVNISNYLDQALEKGGSAKKNRWEDSASGVVYSGAWSTVADVSASGGTVKQSSTIDDYLEFTFTGSYISWLATKNADMGIASVYIDDNLISSVDLYSATKESTEKVFSKSGLSNGVHTMKIVVSSEKNESSTGYGINLDAFDITSTTTAGTIQSLSDGYQSDMDDIDKQVAAMELRLDKYQQTLIAKFTAMEQAIQRIQQMSSAFEQQLSALS